MANSYATHRLLRWSVADQKFTLIWSNDYGKSIYPTGTVLLKNIAKTGSAQTGHYDVWVGAEPGGDQTAKMYEYTNGKYTGVNQPTSLGAAYGVAKSLVSDLTTGMLFGGFGAGLDEESPFQLWFADRNLHEYYLFYGARNVILTYDRIVTPLNGTVNAIAGYQGYTDAAVGYGFSPYSTSIGPYQVILVSRSRLSGAILPGDLLFAFAHPNSKQGLCVRNTYSGIVVGFESDENNFMTMNTGYYGNNFGAHTFVATALGGGGVQGVDSVIHPNNSSYQYLFAAGLYGPSVTRTIECYDPDWNGHYPSPPGPGEPRVPVWSYNTLASIHAIGTPQFYHFAPFLFAVGDQDADGNSVWVFNAHTGDLLTTFSHGATVRDVDVITYPTGAGFSTPDYIDVLIAGDRVRR